jgi:hypothetical protein
LFEYSQLISDGSVNKIALVKDKNGGKIGLAFQEKSIPDDDFYPLVYELCEDEDDFLKEKVYGFFEIDE